MEHLLLLLLRILLLSHLLLRGPGLSRRLPRVHPNVGIVGRVVLALLLGLAIWLLLLRRCAIGVLLLLCWAGIAAGGAIMPGTKIWDLTNSRGSWFHSRGGCCRRGR